jgi:HAD superfamily hydrolase (TIGR01509 family)
MPHTENLIHSLICLIPGRILPMSFPKAILWDMDGVLADTSPLHFATWESTLKAQGIPFDKQQFHRIYGLKNHDLLPFLAGKPMDPQWVERVAARKEMAFRQILHGNLKPLPGVLEWLKRFKSWGCKQAVASSAPPENVEALVDELDIRQYFDALVTPGDLPGKPDPAVFLLAARQLKTAPETCLVIEDSIPGVQAARQAQMRCLAVTTTNPPEALSLADIVVETMAQLTEIQVSSLF